MTRTFRALRGTSLRVLLPLATLLFSTGAHAQKHTLDVPSDILPQQGNLNAAIRAAVAAGTLSQKVFRLQPGGVYVLTETIVVPAGEHLEIIAPEPGTTQDAAPPQILWTADPGLDRRCSFRVEGGIGLQNVWLFYADVQAARVGTTLLIEGDPGVEASYAHFKGVMFDFSGCPDNAGASVSVACRHFCSTFENCYWKNCVDGHFQYYGRAVSFPWDEEQRGEPSNWHIDSLVFENCTFANLGHVFTPHTRSGGSYADYVKFNHCTFLNIALKPLEMGWWHELTMTNCLFVNCCMSGHIPAQGSVHGAIFRIDSTSEFCFGVPFREQERRILLAYNGFFTEPWLPDWMRNNDMAIRYCAEGKRDLVPVPQPMLGLKTLWFFDAVDPTTG